MDFSTLSEDALNRILDADRHSASAAAPFDLQSFNELLARCRQLEVQNSALIDAKCGVEQALHRYADVYDHLPIACVTLNLRGRILDANLTAAQWLGRERSQLRECFLSWFLDAFDAGRLSAHLEGCVGHGTEQHLEVTLRLDNGVLTTVQLSSRAAPYNGIGDRMVHTAITNIAKLKQAHAIADDIASEQISFARSLVHDARAPLANLTIQARHALQLAGDSLAPDLRETIERIEFAAVRTDAVLQHLLDFCHLGLDEIALDPVNLDELVQQVVVEQRGLIHRTCAEISIDRPLPCARGARLILGQVLTCILASMLKHASPTSGARIRISAEESDTTVMLHLTDSALALKPELAESSFRVFEHLHGYDSSLGHGVTLALVRGAIARMNGSVLVGTNVGEGHRVTLAFPAGSRRTAPEPV